MSLSTSTADATRRRRRRRVAIWLTFAALGISMGAVWATGFASVGGANGTNSPSPSLSSSDPAAHTSDLAGTITAGSDLTVDWNGRWGGTVATRFFTVDLDSKSASNNYNLAMLLTNDISNQGWTTVQLKVENADVGTGGTCNATVFDGTNDPKVMVMDSRDAGAYWNNLPGGTTYCVGIAAAPSPASDTNGTFLRRDSDTAGPGGVGARRGTRAARSGGVTAMGGARACPRRPPPGPPAARSGGGGAPRAPPHRRSWKRPTKSL